MRIRPDSDPRLFDCISVLGLIIWLILQNYEGGYMPVYYTVGMSYNYAQILKGELMTAGKKEK